MVVAAELEEGAQPRALNLREALQLGSARPDLLRRCLELRLGAELAPRLRGDAFEEVASSDPRRETGNRWPSMFSILHRRVLQHGDSATKERQCWHTGFDLDSSQSRLYPPPPRRAARQVSHAASDGTTT